VEEINDDQNKKEMIMRKAIVVVMIVTLCLLGVINVAGGQTTLRWLSWTLAEEPSGSVERAMVSEFEKDNPDIKIQLEPVPYPTMNVKFMTQSRARQAPDIFRAYEASVISFAEMGLLLNLEPYIEKSGEKAFKDPFVDALEPLVSHQGNWYGLVSWVVPQDLVYNRDMFTKAGLDPNVPPENWAEFLAYAKKLTKKDEAGKTVQWGFVIRGEKTHSATLRLISFFYRNGARILTEDYSKAALNSPEGMDAFKRLVELYTKDHVIPPGIPEATGGFLNNMIGQERAAMIQHGYNNVGIWETTIPGMKDKLSIVYMPYDEINTTTGLASVMVISSQCEHPEEAWKFITFIVNKKNQVRMFTEANFLPTREDALQMPEIQDCEAARFSVESVDKLTIYPHIAEWPEISFAIIEGFHDATAEDKTPEEALNEVAAKINDVLSK